MQATVNEIQFTDDDIVNPDDFIPADAFNPHDVKPFLIHDHGFTIGVAFAECLSDALDVLADEGILDPFRVEDDERAEYPQDEGISYLGNAGEPFDIDVLEAVELRNPAFSFVALFNAEVSA